MERASERWPAWQPKRIDVRISPDALVDEAREDRYHRQTLIDWWDQKRVGSTRILVIGAGALGNEILKLLALIGSGFTLVYDPDKIERSNLSRSVLFRQSDEGSLKADVAVREMRDINPDVRAHAINDNVIVRAGLGVFQWADVVIGAVDNREARVFINSACARTGKSWVDGAIEGLSGVVRVFSPSQGACYECTMNATDRKLLAERRSCALLARDAALRGHVPTSAVAASIIGAMEVEEAIKVVHGQPTLTGQGLHLDGLHSEVSRVSYPRRADCPGHENLGAIIPLGVGVADVTLGVLLERAEAALGPGAALDLSRDVITTLTCPSCGHATPGRAVLGTVRESQAACPKCATHRVVEITSSISRDSGIDLRQTPADLGLPPFDIIVARQGMERQEAWLFDGDAGSVLGPLAASYSGYSGKQASPT
ncbi:MAG: molybdopterin biosynthesis protein MoeB [Myxococcales bacterium]|nr:molybdopterin biosynthesis protein MoeB [Myxococcales bacterium]